MRRPLFICWRPNSPNFTEIHGALEDIVHEDNRASEVIQRLRGLLKKGESKYEPVDLNQLVDSTTTLLRHQLIERRVTVETDLIDSLPNVLGDPVQLQQVLLNLIMNSMDAMASTPGALRQIQIRTRATEAGSIEIYLKDNGTGIKAADGKRVFVPFYTTKDNGLGLGLSICSTIIEKHGGRIGLRNDNYWRCRRGDLTAGPEGFGCSSMTGNSARRACLACPTDLSQIGIKANCQNLYPIRAVT